MKGLVIALQFMTRLPMPRVAVSDAEFATSIRWFPAAGAVVGAIVSAAAWGGAQIDTWTGAYAALLLWIGVTGALHLDGLGDIADAAGAAHKGAGIDAERARERLLATLADPHVGSFAVVAIGLQLLAKLILLHGLIAAGQFFAIACAAFAARIGPLLWSRYLPDLHAGLGSRFRGAVRPVDLLLWGAVLVAASFLLSPTLMLLPLLVGAWGMWLRRTIGGISGDGHGAGIEICESVLLVAALIWAHAT